MQQLLRHRISFCCTSNANCCYCWLRGNTTGSIRYNVSGLEQERTATEGVTAATGQKYGTFRLTIRAQEPMM
jgi:hypothetical protein